MSGPLLWLALIAATPAQDPPAAEVEVVLPADLPLPGPPPPQAEVEPRTEALARALRCPVCQGMSVADSPSQSALQMKGRIHDLIAAGYTDDQVRDYFVGRYGEWVLLEPPRRGFHWVLWLAPALLLGGALLTVGAMGRRTVIEANRPADDEAADHYQARLLAELEDEGA